MSTERPDKRRIFNTAAEIADPAERAAYLDDACGGDQQLRDEIEDLLKHDLEAGSFLDSPIAELDAPSIDQPITEKPGTLVGPYKLLEQIGEGGMGLVFMARQREPVKRNVALKVIKPGMDSKQVIARFEAERQALALMDHPNIARVLDAGSTESGRPYFVMDLVRGIPITEYCDKKRLSNRERLGMFVSVCQAVQHAHQKGIIHRDLKPTNILVTSRDGVPVPKVIDFGIAKATKGSLTEETLVTNFAQLMGTPLYMAPEQAEISEPDVDTRSDVYSLGVLLYELLTGTTPFGREKFSDVSFDELSRIIREEEPPKPSTRLSTLDAALDTMAERRQADSRTLSREVSGELDWIVMKALEKDRTRRYETAIELANDVTRYLNGEAVEACPPSKVYRLRKFARRNKTAVIASTAVALALIVGAAIATDQAIRATEAGGLAEKRLTVADKQRRLAKKQQRLAQKQRTFAVQQRDAANRNLYLAHMRLAQHDWEAGQISRLHDMLGSHVPGPGRPDYRNWEWYYLLSLCHRDLFTLYNGGGPVRCVAWAPDGTRIASAGLRGPINIWATATRELVATLGGHDRRNHSLDWSPAGERLASGSTGVTEIWDVASGQVALSLRTSTTRFHKAVTWNPDGTRLAAGSSDGTVWIWDATTGQRVQSFTGSKGDVGNFQLAWSPDGKRLACGGGNRIEIWEVTAGKKVVSWGTGYPTGKSLAWSQDGRRLASGSYQQCVKIWDPRTGQEELSIRHSSFVESVSWSPNGKYVACATGQSIRISSSITGEEIGSLRGHLGAVASVAWNPDGALLASAGQDGTVKIWDPLREQGPLSLCVVHSEVSPTILGSGDPCGKVAWSRRGDRLASADGGAVKIWDATAQRQLHSLELRTKLVAWDPDGTRLAVHADGRTVILDAESWNEVMKFDRVGETCSIAWSPNGNRLASAGGRSIIVWDTSTGEKVLRLHADTSPSPARVWVVVWSPDGGRLASGAWDGRVKIWNVATGQNMLTLPHGRETQFLCSLAWSHDGTRLASGGEGNAIKVWDTRTGRELQSLYGHTDIVWAPLVWSPDDQRLASGARDRTVKIWDPFTGEELLSLRAYTAAVAGLDWSPDGQRLAAIGGTQGTIKIWDASRAYEYASSPVYRRDRAQGLAVQGKREEAIAILKRLVYEFPDKPSHRRQLARLLHASARAYYEKDEYDKAIADYNEAIRLDPKHVRAYNDRGVTHREQGKLDNAIADFRAAIQLDAKYARAYSNRGLTYAEKGEFDEAMADFTKAIEAAPNEAICWHRRALVRLAAHDVGAYRSDCAGMLEHFGQTEQAETAFWVAWTCALAPDAVADFSRAIALAKQAVESDPKSASYLNSLGAILYRAGELKEAIQRLTEADQLMQDSDPNLTTSPAYIWFFLAMAHHRLGNHDEAKKWLDKAVGWTERVLREHEDGTGAKLSWNRRLTLKLLREEVETSLKASGTTQQSTPSDEQETTESENSDE